MTEHNPKKQEVLDEIFAVLAKNILQELQEGEVNASMLNVARQFLKDNGIEVDKLPKPKHYVVDGLPHFGEDEEAD